MALFKKAEFAKYCGVSKAHVSVAIKRTKIILDEADLIDSTNATNAAYKAHCDEVAASRQNPLSLPTAPAKGTRKEKSAPKERIKIDPQVKKNVNRKFDVEIQEKEARTQKIAMDMKILEMKQMKMTGQLIPTDLVANTIRQLMQSTMVSFNDAADALLVDVAKSLKIDREMLAGLRKKLKNIVNEAVDRSINDAQKNIVNITQEHSQRQNAA